MFFKFLSLKIYINVTLEHRHIRHFFSGANWFFLPLLETFIARANFARPEWLKAVRLGPLRGFEWEGGGGGGGIPRKITRGGQKWSIFHLFQFALKLLWSATLQGQSFSQTQLRREQLSSTNSGECFASPGNRKTLPPAPAKKNLLVMMKAKFSKTFPCVHRAMFFCQLWRVGQVRGQPSSSSPPGTGRRETLETRLGYAMDGR